MSRIRQNISRNFSQYLTVLATVALVLLTSCPVKSSLKSLAGIPVHTEQAAAKKMKHFSVNSMEKCAIGETDQAQISPTNSFDTNILFPAVLLTVAFLFLLGYTPGKDQSHPLYGNSKITGTLPIFLEYQRLLI